MIAALRPAAVLLALFTLLCGLAYPAVVTGICQVAFSHTADGSLLRNKSGEVVGSALIGQSFTNPGHFWGRPSATSPGPYNAMSSSGTNVGPLNPALVDAVKGRVAALAAADAAAHVSRAAGEEVPVDLVTASSSGLDPDITPAAALYQVPRVAHVRGIDDATVKVLVDQHTRARTLGIWGEPRVNVLELNLALDEKLGPPPASGAPAATAPAGQGATPGVDMIGGS